MGVKMAGERSGRGGGGIGKPEALEFLDFFLKFGFILVLARARVRRGEKWGGGGLHLVVLTAGRVEFLPYVFE
jgi:hypothetical protein